jgi:threonine dehydrogenase-like Zn-dependent dehydrogenase
VRALLPPDGADVVFDAAGFQDSVLRLVRRGGQLIELGWPARDIPNAEMRALFFHGIRIIPSRVRMPDTWRRATSLVASGAVDLRPMVTHRYNIEGGIEAFELLRAKQGVKALIMPQGV